MPPPRQPTRLRALRGNPGKRHWTRVDPAPGPLTDLDTPAELVDAVSRAEWDRVAPALVACGIVTSADRGALIGYCQRWSDWQAIEREIGGRHIVAKKRGGGRMVNPLSTVARAAFTTFLRSAAELGMTPAARSKVNAVPVASAPASKWAGLK